MIARLLALALLLLAPGASALPDLAQPQDLGSVRAWRDHEVSTRWYLEPGPLEIVRDAAGAPELRFLQVRYTGTAATGDQGETGHFSTLTVRLRMKERSVRDVKALRAARNRRSAAS